MKWVELKIEASESLWDLLSNRLFELGAQGVQEHANGLSAFFEGEAGEAAEGEIKKYVVAIDPNAEVATSLVPVADDNWAEKYKEFYYAQELSRRFFLKPLWDKDTAVPPGKEVILMEPGQAFGTGLHPSTKMCIEFLEERGFKGSERTLDVGTGTGILAIVMEKLGAKSIDAIDNDPVAVETAKENLIVNHCSRITASIDPLSKLPPEYDVIVSNILLSTHQDLAAEYAKLIRPGGELILSGLLKGQPIAECLTPHGFRFQAEKGSGEWASFLFRAKA